MGTGTFEQLRVGAESVHAYTHGVGGLKPGVVVFHPWWGLNNDVMSYADRLAAAGFSVVAPDLARGLLATTVEAATALATGLDHAHANAVSLAAVDWLTGAQGAAKVGAVGFSMGGPSAMMCAPQRPAVAASVVYYDAWVGDNPERTTAPVLLHLAEVDPYTPDDAITAFEREIRDAGRTLDVHRYPGTGHWFAEPSQANWRPVAAELAFERTLEFLHRNLAS